MVEVVGRAGHGSGWGGYSSFLAPDPHCAGLNFLTRHPPKKPSIRAGIKHAGRVKKLRVCGFAGRVSLVQSEN
jgi:hypothetical protein